MTMSVQPVNMLTSAAKTLQNDNAKKTSSEAFSDFLLNEIEKVNALQLQADQSTKSLVSGEIDSIHQVMLDTEQARLGLQLTVQIRNKIVEAYQEISRMQF